MDHPPLDAARPEPLITVEPAPFSPGTDRDPEWAHARYAAAPRNVLPGRCPHRVRVRDLKASKRFVFMLVAPLLYGSLLEGGAGLLFGGVMVGLAIDESAPAALILGSIFLLLAAALVFGFVGCVVAWRGLHRPGLPVCVLSTVVPPLILVFVALVLLGGGPAVLVVLVVAPVVPMIVLWYFRAVLNSRSTCAHYPWLPMKIARMIRA